MGLDLLKCPHCGYEGEPCDMPDAFYHDLDNTPEIEEQARLQEELWTHGFNIVTCGECGLIFIHRV